MSHIVVVEDDPYNGILFRKILEKHGRHEVTVTEDAEQLMTLARSGDVALVVMDVSLANTRIDGRRVSGVELCQRMKADPACARVPVVLATAHAMRGDAENLMAESGADEYISKPITDHAAFAELVRRTLAEAA